MLSKPDNELMCRTGPETPMGKAMRHFWIPALLSAELPEFDGDPVHVELLGESFVAFRDSSGNVGMLDEYCCHRGASLTVGRVEKCGIRCIYHGWLFATDGTVLETPNVPDPRFKDRFKAKSYPVREAGGMVWAYLGDPEKMPELPDYEFMHAPAGMRLNRLAISGCNYVQVLEGLLDSSHLSVLHSSALAGAVNKGLAFAQATDHMQFDAAPRVETEETAFGLHYAAIRAIDGKAETRVTAFVSPFWIRNPNGDLTMCCVPMNDEKTAFFHIWYDGAQAYGEEPLASAQSRHVGLDQETLEAYGMTRPTSYGPNRMQRANGFGQDRASVRGGHFTGVASFTQEDAIVCVSAGGLRDRSKEMLSTADLPIAQMYRTLIKSARSVAEGGLPVGYGVPTPEIQGVHATLEPGTDWRTLVPKHKQLKADAA
jgi:phenylpropionate dioxygenase-like ring-hydroxylating dioxygenase large terminal subunit